MFRVLKVFVHSIFLISSVAFIIYLIIPAPELPPSPPRSVQSPEPADVKFIFRPAYFTDFARQETLNHYTSYFSRSPLNNIYLPTYRLNYPPEDSSTLVRAHVMTSYLEELVHPFREYIYINGFKPSVAKDDIWHGGIHFEQKITIRYVTSSVAVRVPLAIVSMSVLWLIIHELFSGVCVLFLEWTRKK